MAVLETDQRPDADLAVDAAQGSTAAFEQLYRRHASAAWRVAYAVTGNPDDAADAVGDAFTRVMQALPAGRLADASLFRSYLLTATRNAAIDLSRRGSRVEHTDSIEKLDDGRRVTTPGERVHAAADASIVVQAFRSLPERWRSVLWLTEVEGIPPKDAAALLGVTPNNAAQLAVRARAGLRERFVQAHLSPSEHIAASCRYTVERLGAYVTGRLTPREVAKVDQHLAACEACRRRQEELEDVGGTLRRIALPLPLLLGPAALAKWKLISAAGTSAAPAVSATAGASAARAAHWSTDLLAKAQKPLLAASTGLFALGVISASVLSLPRGVRGGGGGTEPRSPVIALAAPPNAPVVTTEIRLTSNESPVASVPNALTTELSLPSTSAAPTSAPAGSEQGTRPSGSSDGAAQSPPKPPPGPPSPPPLAQLAAAVRVGPVDAGFIAGDRCQGGSVGSSTLGCDPPNPTATTAGLTVGTDGSGTGAPLAGRSVTIGI